MEQVRSHSSQLANLIENKDIVFSYKGILDNSVISSIMSVFYVLTRKHELAGRKLVKVMVEVGQNISYYSEDRHYVDDSVSLGTGVLALIEKEDRYELIGINKVRAEDGYILKERSLIINKMSRDDLRWLKRITRSTVKREKIGASIGLIQSALISGNTIDIEVVSQDDEFSYYFIKTKFLKNGSDGDIKEN